MPTWCAPSAPDAPNCTTSTGNRCGRSPTAGPSTPRTDRGIRIHGCCTAGPGTGLPTCRGSRYSRPTRVATTRRVGRRGMSSTTRRGPRRGRPCGHPFDDGVWLGGAAALAELPADVVGVVSLCRLGAAQVPARIAAEGRHVSRLIDSTAASENPFLDEVLVDAADAVAALRAEGKVVFLHCVMAVSRTPAVAALYAARHRGVPAAEAWDAVVRALPVARPNAAFREAFGRLTA